MRTDDKKLEKFCQRLERIATFSRPPFIFDQLCKVEKSTLTLRFMGRPLLDGMAASVDMPMKWHHWRKLNDEQLYYHFLQACTEANEHIERLEQSVKDGSVNN